MVLERFHVTKDEAIRVRQEDMRSTLEAMFSLMGMSSADAAQAADGLMYADLRGIESHGVSNLMRNYVRAFSEGAINPRPEVRVVREAAAVATLDSDRGHGLVVGPFAMKMAIEKARSAGIGAVVVGNGRHFGAAAYHAHMAIEHDMIGISMTVGGTAMAPTGGAKALVGLNPLSIAAPARHEEPFIFDGSMSTVAGNKIRLANRLGVSLAPGWVARPDGSPIMEETWPEDGHLMLPVGGTREGGSHKGYSLSVMIDILAGLLSGTGPGFLNRGVASHHFIAYNIAAFTDVDDFKDSMDEYMRNLKDCPPAPGWDRVVYAGLPEAEEEVKRRAEGIPYHPEVIDWFRDITAELDLPWNLTS